MNRFARWLEDQGFEEPEEFTFLASWATFCIVDSIMLICGR